MKIDTKMRSLLLFTVCSVLCFLLLHSFAISAEAYNQEYDIGYEPHIGYDGLGNDISDEMRSAWEGFFGEWSIFMSFLIAMGALTSFIVFIVLMLRLGSSGGNPHLRQRVMRDLLVCFVVTALLGGISVFIALYYQIVMT